LILKVGLSSEMVRGFLILFKMIQIPVSVGELLDKLSILTIKSFKILDKEKARMVRNEMRLLSPLAEPYMIDNQTEDLYTDLLAVNISLWDIEDGIRCLEKNKDFGNDFIILARAVYQRNDERFQIKKRINDLHCAGIQEVKQYTVYDIRNEKG
jgi:hypothetical protein